MTPYIQTVFTNLIKKGLQLELAVKFAPLRKWLGRRNILDAVTTIGDSRKIFLCEMIVFVDIINSLDRIIIQMKKIKLTTYSAVL